MVHVPYFHCPTSEFPFFSIYSYNFRPKINENTNSNNSIKHKQLNEGNYARKVVHPENSPEICTPRKQNHSSFLQTLSQVKSLWKCERELKQ